MPTYAYRCESCQHEFEEYQSITSEPIKVCPECKRPKVRRLIGTGSALLFKGSGFYQTDYRSSSYSEGAKSDSSASSGSSSSGSSTPSSPPSSGGNGGAAAGNGKSNGSNGSHGSSK